MDEKDVQEESVQEGQTSGGSASEAATPQPLTREDFQKMLAESEERTQRMAQSKTDKLRSEVMKGRSAPTPDYGSVLGVLGDAEPEVKAKVYEDLIRRTQAQQNQAAQQEQASQRQIAFEQEWRDDHIEDLRKWDIDPDDKDLDWGNDNEGLLQRQKKLRASVTRIIKNRTESSAANAKKEAADKVAQAAVEAGLESNTAVGGGGSSSTKVFTGKQIGEMTYAEYKANEKDIDAATRAGNIK